MEFTTLETLFNSHQYRQEFQFLTGHFRRVKEENNLIELEAIYQQVIKRFENRIWSNKVPSDSELAVFQRLFREMEQVIGQFQEDQRSHFVIVIPVADRPKQLKRCLQSLYTQCLLYGYGGITDGVYNKVDVVIADDSQDEKNAAENMCLAEEYTSLGLRCEYFGLEQQCAILDSLNESERQAVAAVTGCSPGQCSGHKGDSGMRNLAYLRLAQIADEISSPLFFFIDSDHEFLVKVDDKGVEKNFSAINYFYQFEHIFREKQIKVLTSRETGDPPVSPTVMIGNFLEDVIAFLQRMVLSDPEQDCPFHDSFRDIDNDAVFHDMAELYGHYPTKQTYDYHCPLQSEHTLEDTLNAFSIELNRFFHGEHPTRMIFYHHDIVRDSVELARTVYTGNYIFRPDMLEYFIPFASLNLRMAGSVLGRVIQRELGDDFVLVNSPLLHRRSLDDGQEIDLTAEYQRQFLGDIMLFSVQKLLVDHDLADLNDAKTIADTVFQTRNVIRDKYARQQYNVMKSLTVLESLLRLTGVQAAQESDNDENGLVECGQRFLEFVDTVKHNFSSESVNYALLHDDEVLDEKCGHIISAISRYGQDRAGWHNLMAKKNPSHREGFLSHC